MDPTSCLQRLLDAVSESEWDEAFAARKDLTLWRSRGGYDPDLSALTDDQSRQLLRLAFLAVDGAYAAVRRQHLGESI